MQEEKSTMLSEAVLKEIDRWIAKYPPEQKQSAVLAALLIVQENNGGWLTHELIEAVAKYLDMPKISAYEVATFYSMYEMEPTGRHKISVCNSISCLLRGSENIIEHLEKRLKIKSGETTPDGQFTLKTVECLAACANAPVCMIAKTYHEDLTKEKIDILLQGLGAKIYGE